MSPVLASKMLISVPMQNWNPYSGKARQSGSIRLFIFLLVLIGGLLWAGGQKLHTALTNRKPAVMSYQTFHETKPAAKWLVITNCELNLLRSCYLSYAGDQNPSEYYIPVHDLNSRTGAVSILYKTADPELLATINEIKKQNPDTALSWLVKNAPRVYPRRNIQGLVCFGIDLKSHDREELARVGKNLDPNFVIIDANGQPNLTAGLSYSGAGLAGLVGLIAYGRRRMSETTEERMEI
jgi:hypothetical protein